MQELLKSLLNIVSRITYAVAKGGQKSENGRASSPTKIPITFRSKQKDMSGVNHRSANSRTKITTTCANPNPDDMNHAQSSSLYNNLSHTQDVAEGDPDSAIAGVISESAQQSMTN